MSNTFQILAAVFGGSFFGSFLGPLLLEEIRERKHLARWVKPRKKLVEEVFNDVQAPVVSLVDLVRACGTSEEETREILVSLGARGTTMTNGLEGWYLDRQNTIFTATNIDRQEE